MVLRCASEQNRRGGPADADLIVRSADPGAGKFVVDHQLVDGVRIEPPRRRPVGHHVPGLRELLARRSRVGRDPVADTLTSRVILGWQVEIHRP